MHVFLWVTNAPPPRTKRRRSGLWGIRDTGRETGGGAWQEERGHKRDAQRGVPRMAVFIFLFTLDKAFPAVLSVHWGQQQKRTRGQQTEGSRTVGGASRQTQRRGFFIATTRTVWAQGRGAGRAASSKRKGCGRLFGCGSPWWWHGVGEEMAATLYYCIWDMGA